MQKIRKENNLIVVIPWLERGGSEFLLLDLLKELSKSYVCTLVLTEKSTNPLIKEFKKISDAIIDFSSIQHPKVFGFIIDLLAFKLDCKKIITSNSKLFYESLPYTQLVKKTKVFNLIHNDLAAGHLGSSIKFSPFIYQHICVNNKISTLLTKKRISKSKISTIYNGISADNFYPQSLSKIQVSKLKLGFKKDDLVVGFVGRASPEKNPIFFLKTFLHLSIEIKVKALIVTSGPLEKNIKNFIIKHKLQKKVVWIKACERSKLVDIYNVMDVMVNCSSIEGLPLTLIESLACGTPFVAYNIGGIQLLSNKDNSIILKKGEKLVKPLLPILQNKEINNNMKIAAYNFFKKSDFKFEVMIRKYKATLAK